ncbi:RND family efflux transporter MFP subunit [Sinorhizobium medicae]
MLRKWRLPAVAGVFVSLLVSIPAVAQDAQMPTVTVAKPVVRDVVDADEFIGRFEAVDEVSIRARVGGYLDQVFFTDGALVKKGDKLFVIDQRPFRTALSQAEASLEAARSTLVFAETTFKRTESLAGSGTLSVSRLDDDRRALIAAQANVRGAEAAVERAKLDLDYTTITAPLSGRVDRRLISTGNLVQADQTILTTIVSLDPIDFYFDVDERRLLSYARTARDRGSALQEGAGSIPVLVTIADATSSHSKASSILRRTASTAKPARCGCAPASRIQNSSCSPACSGVWKSKARTPIGQSSCLTRQLPPTRTNASSTSWAKTAASRPGRCASGRGFTVIG